MELVLYDFGNVVLKPLDPFFSNGVTSFMDTPLLWRQMYGCLSGSGTFQEQETKNEDLIDVHYSPRQKM